ncbi:MAG: hypothetical protein CMM87_02410 [Rickettsiales bacterium]|nr:hypothetical protein [Rickettsiales bacterium]|tara:strand:- start:18688 stop:19599 length:912 start_codon:yes stop_codon:yes gene_type:complete
MAKKKLFSKPAAKSSTFEKKLESSSTILLLFSYRRALEKTFIIIACIVSFLLLLDMIKPKAWLYIKSNAQQTLQGILAPIQSQIHYLTTSLSFQSPIKTENALQQQASTIRGLHSKILDLQAELNALSEMRGTQDAPETSYNTITAKIIGFPGAPFKQSLLLNKGSIDQVNINDPILYQGSIIGRVIKTSPHHSYGLLLSDPRSKLPVVIDDGKQKGIASGMSNNRLKIRYVESQEDIEPGMRIRTSGLGGVYPPQLNVGNIEGMKSDYLVARLSINPRHLLFVSIARTQDIKDSLFRENDDA